jgi:hypothetical protein
MRCSSCDGKGDFVDAVSGCAVPCGLCGGSGERPDAVAYTVGSLRYAPQSDTDGETIGTDHYVCDEHGAEVCLARDEASARLFAAAPETAAERDKLQAFKVYVHARLDAAGVPTDPESTHKAEGCRIGGRIDHVFAVRDALLAACEEAAALLAEMEIVMFDGRDHVPEMLRAAVAFAKGRA